MAKVTNPELPEGTYDYENPVACPTRFFDGLQREVSVDLLADIERQRLYLQKAGDSLSTETAKAELENLNMRYLHYSRGQLRECLFEMF